jgi:hypothetical protein
MIVSSYQRNGLTAPFGYAESGFLFPGPLFLVPVT